MFVYKKLKASDVGITAFEAHKEFNVTSSNTASLGVTLFDSSFSSASRDTYSNIFNDPDNHKKYFQLDKAFYHNALFNYGNLIGGLNYNQQEKRLYNKATIVSLSQKTFGNGIQKGSVDFNNNYIDDKKGNLYSKSEILTNYPKDKERVFYLGPVKGFRYFDLTRDYKTGEKITNADSTFSNTKLDDSLYTNVVEYISCSFSENTTLNCPIITLNDGYIKIPHKKLYNFGLGEDFTITFWYQTGLEGGGNGKFILGKSTTKTILETPEASVNGDLVNTYGSSSVLQPKEADAGNAFPFEVTLDTSRKIKFTRADQNNTSTVTHSSALSQNQFSHIAVRKSGSELKVFVNGNSGSNVGTDRTGLCKNEADLFIGSQGGTRENISYDKDHDISQIMIFNKALSHTEIKKVSSSITGTPYVGNVFYENGLITLTSPTVNDGTLTTLETLNQQITLDTTPFTNLGTEEVLFSDVLTLSSSQVTFTSSRDNFAGDYNGTSDSFGDSNPFFENLDFNSTYVSTSFAGGTVKLMSRETASLGTVLIQNFSSESIEPNLVNRTTSTLFGNMSSSLFPIDDLEGNHQNDSFTEVGYFVINSNKLAVFLTENKTISQSFDIQPINSSSILNEQFSQYTGTEFVGQDVNDIDIETDYTDVDINLHDVGNALAQGGTPARVTRAIDPSGADGEVAITGSYSTSPSSGGGYTHIFTDKLGNSSSPRLVMQGFNASNAGGNGYIRPSNGISTDHELSLSENYPGDDWYNSQGSIMVNNTPDMNGVNISDSYVDAPLTDVASFGISDGINATPGFFRLGPGIGNQSNHFFNRYYKPPGNLTFRATFNARRDPDGAGVNVAIASRVRQNGVTVANWFTHPGSVTLTGTSNFYELDAVIIGSRYQANGYLADLSYANATPIVDFKLIFTRVGGGFANAEVLANGFEYPKVMCIDQQYKAGFKNRIAVKTKDDLITGEFGDLLKVQIDGISLRENNSPNLTFPGQDATLTKGCKFNNFEEDSLQNQDLRDLALIIQLRSQDHTNSYGSNIEDQLIGQKLVLPPGDTSGNTDGLDEDISFETYVGFSGYPQLTQEKYYLKFFLGVLRETNLDVNEPSNYVPAFTHTPEGFSIRRIKAGRWRPTTNYDIGNMAISISGSTQITSDDLVADDSNLIVYDNIDDITDPFMLTPTLTGQSNNTTSYLNLINNNEIEFSDPVLITSSFGATASMDIGAVVEVTSSFTPQSKGLYELRDLKIGTTLANDLTDSPQFTAAQGGVGAFANSNLPTNRKVQIETIKNDTIVDTRYIGHNNETINIFSEQGGGKLSLGVLDTTDNIKFVFRTVNSSNESGSLFKNGGFLIKGITATKLTGSNKVKKVDGSTFDPELVGHKIQISSSHTDGGDSSLPFSLGQFTSSITGINGDNTVLTIEGSGSDNSLPFITSSLTNAHTANLFESGPFIISASYTYRDSNNLINTFPVNKLYNFVPNIQDINNENDPGSNLGFGFKANAIGSNTTLALRNDYTETAGGSTDITDEVEFRLTEPSTIKIDLFVSGAESPLYPNGAVTASTLAYTQSFDPDYIRITAISASKISNGTTFSTDQFSPYGFPTTLLRLTSSHTTSPSDEPLFTLGTSERTVIGLTSDGYIQLADNLFITGASNITGSSQSSSDNPLGFSFDSINPIAADGVTEDMIGGTFEFDDLNSSNTDLNTYQIINVIPNPETPSSPFITLNNLDNGADSIQTINDSDFSNLANRQVEVTFQKVTANDFKLKYKNNHLIFENEYHCTVDEHEYNFTLNPTVRKNKSITDDELANFATGSTFRPYVTTIGLYNEEGELLVVGKLGQPVKMSEETDTTFVVRYDT